ncbi:MAG TPA: cytosine permease [Chloroflexota bacterium]
MSAAATEAGILEVEERGIERVPEDQRSDQTPLEIGILWFTVNFVLSSVTTGALAIPAFGLGLWDSLLAVVLWNVVGILPVALFCPLGPLTGLRQMVIARYSFGWDGAKLTALFNIAACIGWSTVNVIIGGSLFHSIWGWPFWVCVVIIAGATTLVSVYGYNLVRRYEDYAWIPLAVAFAIMAVTAVPHIHGVATPAFTMAFFASWVSYGAAIAGFAIGWSSYASDYSVYMKKDTPFASVFWWTFIGEFVACVSLESFGVLLTTWLGRNVFGTDVLSGSVKPLGTVAGDILLLVLVLSVVANNIPNDYSMGLTIQVLGKAWERVKRWVWTLIGAILYTLLAILIVQIYGFTVSNTLTDFLLLVVYWLGPFSIIVGLEHFVFRKGDYDLDAWDDSNRLPRGITPAVIAFVLGLIGAALGANQVKYQGPIGTWFGGDLGFELGTLVAGVTYYVLRLRELRSSSAGTIAAFERRAQRR